MTLATTTTATDDYLDFCRGVRALCRIDLAQYKRGQMERRIRTFASGRGVPELADYLKVLRRDRSELDAFLDRITINVSQLWRNPEQWTVLGEHVLPELAAEGRVRAWSAGCSYGAEAYTLAAVAADAVPAARIEVRGTDIDERIIAQARTGRFSLADARSAPARALERWFVREDDEYVARPELRRGLRFDVGDLLRMRISPASYDLILCRNTVIYFNQEVRDDLHRRLADALRPGGVLVVGATERVADAHELGLSATHPFTYRKAR
jgi:chemotaxis protein methyltransferase CheR